MRVFVAMAIGIMFGFAAARYTQEDCEPAVRLLEMRQEQALEIAALRLRGCRWVVDRWREAAADMASGCAANRRVGR